MTWNLYLFGFRGRLNRAQIWLFFLIALCAFAVLGGVLALVRTTIATVVVTVAICIPLFIAGIATAVKRLHDRNRSGWWVVLFLFVPAVLYLAALVFPAEGPGPLVSALLCLLAAPLSLWGFIEIYCLRGTEGDNRFGTAG